MRLLIAILQILFSFRNNPARKSLLIVKNKICHVSHCVIFPVSVYFVLRTALCLSNVNSLAEHGCSC
jgi:hypothetical protein